MEDAPLPGPWRDPDAADPEPWTHAAGPLKLFELVARRPEMSARAFHLYWQRHHSPHVMNCTAFAQFIRKYTSVHRREGGDYPGEAATLEFDGAAEVCLDSVEDLGRWLSHPLYPVLIQPDEMRFLDLERLELSLLREQRVHWPEPDFAEGGHLKVLSILSRRPGLEREAFHRRLAALARALAADADVRALLPRIVVSHRLCDPVPEGFPMGDIDAVVELWCRSDEQLRAFRATPAWLEYQGAESELVRPGGVRSLVGTVHVVHDELSFQPSLTHPLPFEGRG
jgi:hypothetical protein